MTKGTLLDNGVFQAEAANAASASIGIEGRHSTSTTVPSLGRYVWYVIGLITVVDMFNYMDRTAFSVLMPEIKKDIELSDGQLGLLVGLSFSLFYAVCGIPIARWADRGNRRNIIALAVATWSFMTAATGLGQHFWHILLARMGVGAGEAGCLPPGQSILCDYVPLEKRAGVFSLTAAGLTAGSMIGMALSGWLAEWIGWRLTFIALGLPGLILALVVRFTLREPKRGTFDSAPVIAGSSSLRATLSELSKCKGYVLLVLYLIAGQFAQSGLNQWWPSFYTRVWGLPLSDVGLYLGVGLGLCSGTGLLVGGLLANWTAKRDVTLPLVIGSAAIVLAIPTVLGSLFASSSTVAIVLTSLIAFLFGLSTGPVIASIYSVTTASTRATAGAFSILLSSIVGGGLGPLCVGLLSDHLTPRLGTEALRYALLCPVSLYPVAACLLYAAARQLPKDLNARRTLANEEKSEFVDR